jgi:hypothetical protein
MINGAHVIILSKQPEADRAFFRDLLGLPHVDVGGGWLIFALPPAEVAVHPSERESVPEFYLMCEDVGVLVKTLRERGIACGPIEDQGWGLLTSITLPGGGTLGAYEPRHARPFAKAPSSKAPSQKSARSAPPKKKTVTGRAPGKASARRGSGKATAKSVSKPAARKEPVRKSPPKKVAKRAVGRKRR